MVDSEGKRLESPAVKNAGEFDKAVAMNKFSDQ
jgi:hypothetical protein